MIREGDDYPEESTPGEIYDMTLCTEWKKSLIAKAFKAGVVSVEHHLPY